MYSKPTNEEAFFSDARERMVWEQIEARGVRHPDVLDAMRKTPRHFFVPGTPASIAYGDHPLPIDDGQTISQPFIVAYMVAAVLPETPRSVLEIGTGSGYQTAVLSLLFPHVWTVERIPALARRAEQRFTELGLTNISTRIGDGWYGWPEAGPFSAILVTAAAKTVPPDLVEQLSPGGRMLLPLGPVLGFQQLVLVQKDFNRQVNAHDVMDVRFVPLIHPDESEGS